MALGNFQAERHINLEKLGFYVISLDFDLGLLGSSNIGHEAKLFDDWWTITLTIVSSLAYSTVL
jgi:hypothetical protein